MGFAMHTDLSITVAYAACFNCSSNADLVGGTIPSKIELELKHMCTLILTMFIYSNISPYTDFVLLLLYHSSCEMLLL